MIKIEIPNPDIVITKKLQLGEKVESVISSVYGFTDYHRIPRDKGGMILSSTKKMIYYLWGKQGN